MVKAPIYIGTSGWSYSHWDDVFYPSKLPPKEKLPFYSQFFGTVEINTTFYHVPKEETVKNWNKLAATGFLYSVKASQYITHRKRLKDCEESLHFFYDRVKYLKTHLGPILFQLPPSFKLNMERLKEFTALLEKKYTHVFEFRHPSWFTEEVYEYMKLNKLGLCITDLGGQLSPEIITSHFAYLRLHGPNKKYQGSYGTKKLREWKQKIMTFSKEGIATYCYFDNDEKGFAVQDAKELIHLLKLNPENFPLK